MVQLRTTGNGAVRFNPNLYNCGKVCLSLLGTWEGPSWDPTSSTLLQVLVSIQALILVPDPYFNEPGHEASMRSSNGKSSSETYNRSIRPMTVQHAMLGQLKPCMESGGNEYLSGVSNNSSNIFVFGDIIRKHFLIKKAFILKQLREWKLETTSAGLQLNKLLELLQ